MREFGRIFAAILVFLAGIAALGLGAAAIHALWIFYVVVGGSLVLAGAVWAVRHRIPSRFVEWANRFRAYPALLKQYGVLLQQSQGLQDQVTALREDAKKAHVQGRQDGRDEMVGVVLGAMVEVPPMLTSVTFSDGILALIGEYEEGQMPDAGCRFDLVVKNTQDRRGVVQVRSVDEALKTVELVCVERTVPAFWDRLESKSLEDPSPPEAVALTRYQPLGSSDEFAESNVISVEDERKADG